MGEWRFGFDPKICANSPWLDTLEEAGQLPWYLGGMEGNVSSGVTWETEGNFLIARTPDETSARLFTPCELPSFGQVFLFTGSLMHRAEPYNLLIELARGKIGHLRNQSSQWRLNRMHIPEEFDGLLEEAHRLFSQGVQFQFDYAKSGELALKSLENAQIASEMLMNSFVRQRLKLQKRKHQTPPVQKVCTWSDSIAELPQPELVTRLIDEIRLPFIWNQLDQPSGDKMWSHFEPALEWCGEQNVKISGGPLLDFSDRGMPETLSRWSQDVLSLQSIMCDYLESTISQFGSRIRKWEVVSAADKGAYDPKWNFLTEEIRLKLTMKALEVVTQVDPQLELSVGVVDPWGVFQNGRKHQLNPLQFVDILTRSRANISTLNLQLTRGFEYGNSPQFDELELGRLLDLWGRLGIPIEISLATPSRAGRTLSAEVQPHPALTQEDLNETAQADWYSRIIPLLLAKDCVKGIRFGHFSDQSPHHFAHAGLLNEAGTPKAVLERIQQYLDYNWLSD